MVIFNPCLLGPLSFLHQSIEVKVVSAKGNFRADSNLPRTDSARQIGQIGQQVTWLSNNHSYIYICEPCKNSLHKA